MRLTALCFVLVSFLFASGGVLGQEDAPFGRIPITVPGVDADGNPAPRVVQRALSPSDPMSILLHSPYMRELLGVTDKQYEKLNKVSSETFAERMDFATKMLTEDGVDPRKIAVQAFGLANELLDIDIEEQILTKEQFEKFTEMRLLGRIKANGLIEVVRDEGVKEEAEISDSELAELELVARKIDKELTRKIRQLKLEAVEDLLSELNKKKKAIVKDRISEAMLSLPEWSGISRGDEPRGSVTPRVELSKTTSREKKRR